MMQKRRNGTEELSLKRQGHQYTSFATIPVKTDYIPETLNQDFKSNHIRLVNLRPSDLAGASVQHLLGDDQSGEEIWWNAEILDLYLTCNNQKDAMFFVLYHMDDMEYQVDEMGNTEHEYYEVTLMKDYHNNLLHIRSVDLSNEDINFDFKT